MAGFFRTLCLLVCVLCVQRAGAHGSLAMDEDTCTLRVGRYVMHFVGFQPNSASGPREFCEDIPETGYTVVVLDFLNDELRDLPTEVRVVRDTGGDPAKESDTLLHIAASRYPSGSLNFEMNFAEPGKFIGLVTVAGKQQVVGRFPFSVGKGASSWRATAALALLAVAAVVAFRVARSRRRKASQPRLAA